MFKKIKNIFNTPKLGMTIGDSVVIFLITILIMVFI